MTGRREELLIPLVPPWAAFIIDRDCGEYLERRAREYAADPRTADIGRQLSRAVRQLRAAGRRQWEAYQAAERVEPATVADGDGGEPGAAYRVTPKEAAPMLGVGVRQVVNMCRRDDGPLDAVLVGGRWLIDEVSLAAEMERRRAA